VLDFSAVNNIDITSANGLVDLRNTLNRHAAPELVDWHFASVLNRWTRRALAVSGFGYPSVASRPERLDSWSPVYTVTGSADKSLGDAEKGSAKDSTTWLGSDATLEPAGKSDWKVAAVAGAGNGKAVEKHGGAGIECVLGVDRPFFHIDLAQAVEVAVRDARRQDGARQVMSSPGPKTV
jgi:sodium-independent sulfate anion transporter 11